MTVEEIYLRLKDELSSENEISSSPERIFIKNEEHTICTLGMNRSHEIIFVEFKPAPKDLAEIGREAFVHPHPVEMLHDAGWRQAQITTWEDAERLLEIINRSYKKKKKGVSDEMEGTSRQAKIAAIRRHHAERIAKGVGKGAATEKKGAKKGAPAPKPAKKQRPVPKAKPGAKARVAAKKARPEKKVKPKVKAREKAVAGKAATKKVRKTEKKGNKKK